MTQPRCKTCGHPEVAEIDRLLITGEAGGLRKLSERFGVSRDSLRRHKQKHLASAVAKASGAVITRVDPDPSGLVQQLASLELRVNALLDKAEAEGETATAIRAATELRNQVELLAKLMGELSGSGLSRADLKRITREMAAVVEASVRDPEVLAQIQEGWRNVRII